MAQGFTQGTNSSWPRIKEYSNESSRSVINQGYALGEILLKLCNYCQWILSWIRYFYAVIFVLKIKYVDSMQAYLLCNLKSDFEIYWNKNVYNYELNVVAELIHAYCM